MYMHVHVHVCMYMCMYSVMYIYIHCVNDINICWECPIKISADSA